MGKKSPVHIESRQDGWAVVREGNERATSVHRTQAKAAKEGRDIARKEETEFFLHARDGRIREHNSYAKEEPPPEREEVAGHANQGAAEEQKEIRQEAGDPVVQASDAAEQDHGGPLSEGAGDMQEEVHEPAAEEQLVEQLDQRSGELQERYAGYEVRDVNGDKIGELDHLFVGGNDQLEYIGSKTDPTETSFVLIPIAAVRIDEERQMVEVNALKCIVKDGPALESEEEATPEFERRVCDYYGVTVAEPSGERTVYGAYHDASGSPRGEEDPAEPEGASTGEEEFRMQRAEEELKVGTREREVGAVVVRKRVRTEHEQIEVPKKRVEVTVERVPKEGEPRERDPGEEEILPVERQSNAKPEFEEDEIVVPAVEEEVVVEKRPVVREEIRIRKDEVEDTKIVEEEVRREEVEVDDQQT